MTDWQVAEAKNRFSELITKALKEGPQRVTRRDEAVMVVAADGYPSPLVPTPLIASPAGMTMGRHEFRPNPVSQVEAGVRRVLLVIGGGIAAYKALELIRLLKKRGIETRAIVTKAGEEFVTPLSIGALTGDKVYSDLFSLSDEAEMGHIQLSRSADFIAVVPATADLIAKAANGMANDLASTTLLATDKPVLMAPAMNVRMWLHPATQRNIATLTKDGVRFVGPDDGDMACGEFGPGRMAEPEAIAQAIDALYAEREGPKPLAGKRIIITAGPTQEPIDPVRFLSNHSSGKQGYAIAESLAKLGADVVLVSGPVSLPAPKGVTLKKVTTALEMAGACDASLPADAAICVAAVADWRPEDCADIKIKKDGSGNIPVIALTENPDILATLSKKGARRPRLVVGFAAETDHVEEYAQAKLIKKGCDWIVANDVSGDVMGGAENEVALVKGNGIERWPRMPKGDVADKLAAEIALALV